MTELVTDAHALEFWLWTGGLGLFVLLSFAGSFYYFKRARLIEDTPTARVRSAPQGYVELEGWALPAEGRQTKAPLSGYDCLWWEYRIQQRQTTYSNGRQHTRWKTVEEETSRSRFFLDDDSGRCEIDPKDARVTTSIDRTWYGNSRRPSGDSTVPIFSMSGSLGTYRYSERLILGGEKLYALGSFRTEHEATTRDGGSNTAGTRHVLSRPIDQRPFLLSTTPQAALTRSYRSAASKSFAAFLGGGSLLVWMLVVRGVF